MSRAAEILQLRGTIVKIEAGVSGGDWTYLISDHQGNVTRLLSAWPLAADAGDDVAVKAVRQQGDADGWPIARLDRPPRVLPRFAEQVMEGEVRSFGTDAGPRPGLVAAAALKLRLIMGRLRHGGHLILRAPDRAADPVLQWGADLLADVLPEQPVFLIDPLAYDHGQRPLFGTRAERAEMAMEGTLPALLAFEKGRLARDLFQHPSGNTTLFRLKGALAGPAVVQPYNPYETAAERLAGYSRLPPDRWQPRRIIPADWRRRYTLAHELAHTVQHRYGFGASAGEVPPALQHQMECFADGFAILALAHAGAPRQVLADLVDHRRIGLIAAPTGYFTAPVGDAAVAAAAAGQVAGQSTESLLALAADLTRRYALDEAAYHALDQARKSALMKGEAGPKDSKLGTMVSFIKDGGRAHEAMSRAMQLQDPRHAPIAALWPGVTAALDRLCVGPAELATADGEIASTRRAAADLAETLAALPPGRRSRDRLIATHVDFIRRCGAGRSADLLADAARDLPVRTGDAAWPAPSRGLTLIRPRRP